MFKTRDEAVYYIENIKRKEKRQNLDRMKKALMLLGNPQNAYKVIHIAGTNGKGSTVSYLSSILIEANYKVGSFISPYVITFNERIMINLQYISDEDLIKYANIIYNVSLKLKEEDEIITFFEFITLMGLLYFKDQEVDYAIVEVGMGGILDATNIFDNALRVITNIGFDHMNSLGYTLEEIASKKLGIVHENETLITSVNDTLLDYFKSYVNDINANMIWINDKLTNIEETFQYTSFKYNNVEYRTPLLGIFQAFNAALAIQVIKHCDSLISDEVIQRGLDKTQWPGRLQVIMNEPTVIIDGGHNIHGVCAVVKSIKGLTSKKVHIVFTALHDKEIDKMLAELDTIASDYVFTTINDIRACSISDITPYTTKPYISLPDINDAINHINSFDKSDIVLITGSLHFISNVIDIFSKKNKK